MPKIKPPDLFFSGLIIMAAIYYIFPAINVIPFPYNLSGIAVVIAGFIPMSQAYFLFQKNETPHNFDDAEELIEEGIFRRTRNPMYISFFVMLAGFAIIFNNIFSFSIPLIFLILIQVIYIPFEERKLKLIFGEKYENYKKRAPRWI